MGFDRETPLADTAFPSDPLGRADSGQPPDRVFLSNYVRAFEIGAYAEERGRTQNVRFDIVLEVARNTAHIDDRPARVVNYGDLVDAIEDLIAGPRINLLETFAERLALACLADPRAQRVKVRIEKMDRLPGEAGLGVEIVRRRITELNERVLSRGSD